MLFLVFGIVNKANNKRALSMKRQYKVERHKVQKAQYMDEIHEHLKIMH